MNGWRGTQVAMFFEHVHPGSGFLKHTVNKAVNLSLHSTITKGFVIHFSIYPRKHVLLPVKTEIQWLSHPAQDGNFENHFGK